MDVRAYFKDKQILSWALYDWANSAFATSIMAAFFPIFFRDFWSHGVDARVASSRLAFSIGVASFIVAILAPFLGAIADQVNAKKKFLLFFLTIGVTTTGALTFTAMGHWQAAVILYAFATIGFSGSNIFYDAFLVFISQYGPSSSSDVFRLSFFFRLTIFFFTFYCKKNIIFLD